MKLRIQGNSLRLRLSRGEVERLDKTGSVHDGIEFGPGSKLTYYLKVSNDASAAQARLNGSTLEVDVPGALVRDWAQSDRVGISAEQYLDAERTLLILIEKDFACIHKEGRPEEDTFPNPLVSQSSN